MHVRGFEHFHEHVWILQVSNHLRFEAKLLPELVHHLILGLDPPGRAFVHYQVLVPDLILGLLQNLVDDELAHLAIEVIVCVLSFILPHLLGPVDWEYVCSNCFQFLELIVFWVL